jgi:hypothetical protein
LQRDVESLHLVATSLQTIAASGGEVASRSQRGCNDLSNLCYLFATLSGCRIIATSLQPNGANGGEVANNRKDIATICRIIANLSATSLQPVGACGREVASRSQRGCNDLSNHRNLFATSLQTFGASGARLQRGRKVVATIYPKRPLCNLLG